MALAIDLEIRSLTDGKRGFDDVMRLMQQRFGETGQRFGVEDVLQ